MKTASDYESVWVPWGRGRRRGFMHHIAWDRRVAQLRANPQEGDYIDTAPILEYKQSAAGIEINRFLASDIIVVHFVASNV